MESHASRTGVLLRRAMTRARRRLPRGDRDRQRSSRTRSCSPAASGCLPTRFLVTEAARAVLARRDRPGARQGRLRRHRRRAPLARRRAVFAAGDCRRRSWRIRGRRPASSPSARVRRWPRNLRRALSGQAPKPFVPQKHFLSLIGTGDRRAVASKGPFAFERRLALGVEGDDRSHAGWPDTPTCRRWRMPCRCPRPRRCDAAAAAPRSRATPLSRALARLPKRPNRDDVLIGLADRDDVAAIAVPPGQALLQSADFFRALVDDPYLVRPDRGGPLRSATSTRRAASRNRARDRRRPLRTARARRGRSGADAGRCRCSSPEAGAALIGGHSSEGAELAFGLSVTARCRPIRSSAKAGTRPATR